MKWINVIEQTPEKKTDDLSKDKGIIFANTKRTAIMYVFLSITPNIPALLQNDLKGWEWLDESTSLSSAEEEKDSFAISFAIWALHDPQAKAYQEAGITAYGLLEKYKDRPYINTDTSKQ